MIIIFSRAGPISRYEGVVFGVQREFRDENGLNQLDFNYAQLCINHYKSCSPPFRDLSILFQYLPMRSITEIRLPSHSHYKSWFRNSLNQVSIVLNCTAIILGQTCFVSEIRAPSSPQHPSTLTGNIGLGMASINSVSMLCNRFQPALLLTCIRCWVHVCLGLTKESALLKWLFGIGNVPQVFSDDRASSLPVSKDLRILH